MINRLKKEKNAAEKDKLREGFPKAIRSEVDAVLTILPFDDQDSKWTGRQIIQVDHLFSPSSLTVQLDNEWLSIPSRIYVNEPASAEESTLTDIQKTILNCIYLRHFDGYVRQRRLEYLVDINYPWVIPFTTQLLGEYVFEILQVLNKHINEKTIESYVKFSSENPIYWKQIESRMTSYWNAYYRQKYPKLQSYLGQELIEKIKNPNDK